jgi:hypothetical protein
MKSDGGEQGKSSVAADGTAGRAGSTTEIGVGGGERQFELTEQQLQMMATFGFLHLPGLLADKIEPITAAFEEMIAAHSGGGRGAHEGVSSDNLSRASGRSGQASFFQRVPGFQLCCS